MIHRIIQLSLLFAALISNVQAQSDVYGHVSCDDILPRTDLTKSPDSAAYMDYVSDSWDDSLGLDDYLWDHFFTIELYESFPEFEGKYDIEYVIESDGTVSDVCFNQGISIKIDAIMYTVWEDMPKWEPAIKNGKPIAVKQNFISSYKNGD